MCIWFQLAMLMTKTNPSSTFPSLLHSPLGNPVNPSVQSLTFQVSLAPPSPVVHPLEKLPRTRRYKNQGISLPENHHTSNSMRMEINGHYWVLVSQNGPTPEVPYKHIATCSNFFYWCCQFLHSISTTQPGMFMHVCSNHIISIRFK